MRKKILPLVLSLAMVFSMAPMVAHADEIASSDAQAVEGSEGTEESAPAEAEEQTEEGVTQISEEVSLDSGEEVTLEAPTVQQAAVAPMALALETITELELIGLRAPIIGEDPLPYSFETDQYVANVNWAMTGVPFTHNMVYGAGVTIVPKPGYTLDGLGDDAFTSPIPCVSISYAQGSDVVSVSFLTPPSGYITDGQGTMAYRMLGGSAYDVVGFFHNEWKQNTYDHDGYRIILEVDGNKQGVNMNNGVGTALGLEVTISIDFSEDGKTLKYNYHVKNLTDDPITFSLGVGADIQIGHDDSAPIHKYDDGRGFYMVSRSNSDLNPATGEYAQFNFFGKGVAGIDDVDTFWFGHYGSWTDNVFNQINVVDYSGDSGMAYSWKNRTVAGANTNEYSVGLGIGGLDSAFVLGYSVQYMPNIVGVTATMPPEGEKPYNQDMTISSSTPTAPGYVFVKYNTEADGTGMDYMPGDTYSDNSPLTLYAQWNQVASASEEDLMIIGIEEGKSYPVETGFMFTAVGSNMDLEDPTEGDYRLVPSTWSVNPSGSWSNAPYSASFNLTKAGNYQLSVVFREETLQGGTWTATGDTVTKSVNFTATEKAGAAGTVKPSPATGDESMSSLWILMLIGAALAMIGIQKRRITVKK